MNTKILSPKVQDFISNHTTSSVTDIALSSSPFNGISSAELAQQIEGKQRLVKKIPLWVNTLGIYYPQRRSLEQCSSDIAANYKANLISGHRALDMTGGMGVDTWAIAQNFEQMIYCELNKELCNISTHNFKTLGVQNITTFNCNALELLQKNTEPFDTIYIDPARRDNYNRKMVSFTDCQPDVVENMDLLWQHTSQILIKASPMMDINRAISELTDVKEVHIVAVKNECKELLFLLEKGFSGEILFVAANLQYEKREVFTFTASNELHATATTSLPQQYLYEPNSSMLKSGAFKLLSTRYNIHKLHAFTHIYTSNKLIKNFPGTVYTIKNISDYNKKQIKKLLPNKKANIKCYNFIDKPAIVQKRLQLKDGGTQFLFAIKNIEDKFQLLLCEKTKF